MKRIVSTLLVIILVMSTLLSSTVEVRAESLGRIEVSATLPDGSVSTGTAGYYSSNESESVTITVKVYGKFEGYIGLASKQEDGSFSEYSHIADNISLDSGDLSIATEKQFTTTLTVGATYKIYFSTNEGEAKSVIIMSLLAAFIATSGITYTTSYLELTKLNEIPIKTENFTIDNMTYNSQYFINGQNILNAKDENEISEFYSALFNNGIVTEEFPEVINVTGKGIITVYIEGNPVGSYSTSSDVEFKQLCESYGWDAGSLAAFEQRKNMNFSIIPTYNKDVTREFYIYDPVSGGSAPMQSSGKDTTIEEHFIVKPNSPVSIYYIPDSYEKMFPGYKLLKDKLMRAESKNDIDKKIYNHLDSLVIPQPLHYKSPKQTNFRYYYQRIAEIPQGKFIFEVEPKETIEWTQPTINNSHNLTVNFKDAFTADEKDNWFKYLRDLGNASVNVNINITQNGRVAKDETKTLTPDQFKSFIDSKVMYQDSVSGVPIGEGQTVVIPYKCIIKATVNGSSKDFVGNPDTGKVTYKRPYPGGEKVLDDDHFNSEIKAGAIGSEPFEAMAGTPTTIPLYFASGGQEFLASIKVEYHGDGSATRNYKSEFKSVPCGWNMDVITGSRQKDSPPPQPTARTKTDASGASYTETVTSHDAEYIKEVIPNPPPAPPTIVKGKEYWWVQEGHSDTVGGYTDTWSQSVTYDYMKILDAKVYKLDKSYVNGMKTLIGQNEVFGTVTQGNPTIFYNIASTENSAGGRLRYSLEPDQHDNVYWNEGNSDNAHSNSKDACVVKEQDKFKQRREMTTTVTAASDFIILQTSSGEQSLIYFEKTSPAKKTTEALEVPKTSKEAMWDNNPLSCAKWRAKHSLNIGSYKGVIGDYNTKYSQWQSSKVPTIFDSLPAGLTHNSGPGEAMRLQAPDLTVKNIPNKEYTTGISKVFYKEMINYGPEPSPFTVAYSTLFKDTGVEKTATYSPTHNKVNDVVIHDPVSSEFATFIGLPNSRDQRTSDSIKGTPFQPKTQTIKVLDPNYRSNLIFNGKFDYISNNLFPDWKFCNWNDSSKLQVVTDPNNTNEHCAKIVNLPTSAGKDYCAFIYQIIDLEPNTNYKLEFGECSSKAKSAMHVQEMKDTDNPSDIISTIAYQIYEPQDSWQNRVISFKTGSITKIRIAFQLHRNTVFIPGIEEYVALDNVSVTNMDKVGFIPITRKVYASTEVPNTESYKSKQATVTDGVSISNGGIQEVYDYKKTDPISFYCYNYTSTTNGSSGWIEVNTTAQDWGIFLSPPLTREQYDNIELTMTGPVESPGQIYFCNRTGDSMNENHVRYFTCPAGNNKVVTIPMAGVGWSDMNSQVSLRLDIYNNINNDSRQYTYALQKVRFLKGGGAINIPQTISNQYSLSAPIAIVPANRHTFVSPIKAKYKIEACSGIGANNVKAPNVAHGVWTHDSGCEYEGQAHETTTNNQCSHCGHSCGSLAAWYPESQGGTFYGGDSAYISGTIDLAKDDKLVSYFDGVSQNIYKNGVKVASLSKGTNASTSSNGTNGSVSLNSLQTPGSQTISKTLYNSESQSLKVTFISQDDPETLIENRLYSKQPDTEPPAEAFIDKIVEYKPDTPIQTPLDSITGTQFINLDYAFKIYFPNKGNFDMGQALHISSTQEPTGYGFTNEMDTTTWTKKKTVEFNFNVSYKGVVYPAGTEIELKVSEDVFEFYCLLANKEAVNAKGFFRTYSINNPTGEMDNEQVNNMKRYDLLDARHSSIKEANIDIVGRIGNYITEDTGDWRFANFFKQSIVGKWIVPNVANEVQQDKQNNILGSKTDIRAETPELPSNKLNTWGTESAHEREPVEHPLTSNKNNIPALRNQPLRPGYNLFQDVQTMGNYYDKLGVRLYYYSLDLRTGVFEPVDVYMNVNGSYKRVNSFNKSEPEEQFKLNMNWADECMRRNVGADELDTSYRVSRQYDKQSPSGSFNELGNAQQLLLGGTCKTFIGSSRTNKKELDVHHRIPQALYQLQAQRWHMTQGLPSSSRFVLADKPPTDSNIKSIGDRYHVILGAAKIVATGDLYSLEYKSPTVNNTIEIAGQTYSTASIPYNLVTVYSANKTSADDLNVSGTH